MQTAGRKNKCQIFTTWWKVQDSIVLFNFNQDETICVNNEMADVMRIIIIMFYYVYADYLIETPPGRLVTKLSSIRMTSN
jgi:hypothetical protein